MTAVMWANVALAAVAGLLALALGLVYWRNHREIRSPFTLGLLLFAAFLVVHDAVVVYHLLTMMATFTGASETYLLLENALQVGALSALLAATLR